MMRGALVAVLLTVCIASTSAQYSQGKFFVGPTLGLMAPEITFGFGLQGEYAITENWGAMLGIGYTAFDLDGGLAIPGMEAPYASYTLLSIGAGATYHLMPNEQFDPYAALGIGYYSWDYSYFINGKEQDFPMGQSAAYDDGVSIFGAIGARYHFSDLFSARLSLGYPMIVGAGVDFGFGGKKTEGEADTTTSPPYAIYAGVYVNGKASIKTEVPEGFKTGVLFNIPPDFGASIAIPFGAESDMAFALDFGLANYGYITKPESKANDSNTIEERYSYINVFPHFNLGGFIIGVNWGFPTSASTMFVNGDSASVVGQFVENPVSDTTVFVNDPTQPNYDPTKYMATMLELRIGGSIPIVKGSAGRLCINVQAGYTLSNLFSDYRNYQFSYPMVQDPDDPSKMKRGDPDESLNPVMPSLAIGLQWDFRIGF